MKKKIIPEGTRVLGVTPFEKFCSLTRQVLSVPKAEIDRREAEWKKAKALKKEKRGDSLTQ